MSHPIDPMLGPLQDNGGGALTQALLSASTAIDAGDNTAIANPPFPGPPFTDQRSTGFHRLINTVVDIGAYEYQQPATLTVLTSSAPLGSTFGQTVTFTAAVGGSAPGSNIPSGTVTFSIDGTPQTPAVKLDSKGSATFSNSSLSSGSYTIGVTYNGFTQGNYSFDTSDALPITQVVTGNSTTTLTATPSSTVFGQSVTFQAVVSAIPPAMGTPSGTVDSKDGRPF